MQRSGLCSIAPVSGLRQSACAGHAAMHAAWSHWMHTSTVFIRGRAAGSATTLMRESLVIASGSVVGQPGVMVDPASQWAMAQANSQLWQAVQRSGWIIKSFVSMITP